MAQPNPSQEPKNLQSIDSAKNADDAVGAVRVSAEKAVLGSILIGPTCYPFVADQLKPEMFYRGDHRVLFETMAQVWKEHGTLDSGVLLLKLMELGKKRSPGWGSYIAELTGSIPIASELAPNIRLVRSAYQRREIMKRTHQLLKRLQDPETDPMIEVEKLSAKAIAVTRATSEEGRDIYLGNAVELETRYLETREDTKAPIQSGFTDLDEATGGFPPDGYVVIGARSGDGKSILALTLARQMAEMGYHVAFLALEMPNRETYCRNLGAMSGVPSKILMDRAMEKRDWGRISEATARLDALPLSVFDRMRSLAEIDRTMRSLKQAGRLDVLVVDTINLVTAPGKAYEASTSVSVGMRALSIELQALVIGVAQFTKDADKEPRNKRPDRTWLKGGAHIYQDAADLLLLHRPDELAAKVEVILEKRRHGRPGKIVNLAFLEDVTRFENWTNREAQ